MNKTIWRFRLERTVEQWISMPKDARVLSAQVQGGSICLWALVNTEATREQRRVCIVKTGFPLSHVPVGLLSVPVSLLNYVGTVLMDEGDEAVYHVFA